jgi:hypothetical protein
MNAYDSVHVTAHARMSKGGGVTAGVGCYTPEHVETVIRRAADWGFDTNKIKWMMLSFHATAAIEGVHPLDSGIFRRKYRGDRRADLPREPRCSSTAGTRGRRHGSTTASYGCI